MCFVAQIFDEEGVAIGMVHPVISTIFSRTTLTKFIKNMTFVFIGYLPYINMTVYKKSLYFAE